MTEASAPDSPIHSPISGKPPMESTAEIETTTAYEVVEAPPRRRPPTARAHIWAAVWAVLGVVSIFVLAPLTSRPELMSGVRDSLDGQQTAVGVMAATSTGISAALSAIPGDAMTPIANQLAELSGWFMVIIAAIILQKLLLTTAGFVAFTFIIPFACALGVFFVYSGRRAVRAIAYKLAAFGIVLFLAVPGSIFVSGMLTQTHTNLTSVTTETAADAKPAAPSEKPDKAETQEQRNEGLIGEIQNFFDDVGSNVENFVDDTAAAANKFSDDAVDALNSYIEKIALFVITTCVMPLLVFLLFGWVIKMLFSIDIGVGRAAHAIQSRTSRGVTMAGRGVSRAARRPSTDTGA